jgi:hypothetical protein
MCNVKCKHTLSATVRFEVFDGTEVALSRSNDQLPI